MKCCRALCVVGVQLGRTSYSLTAAAARGSIRMAHSSSSAAAPKILADGITSIDHTFTLPLVWGAEDDSKQQNVQVFARELYTRGGANRPCLLFLQGGPGFPSQRPVGASGWISAALKEFRVILLDQRGTGKAPL